MASKRYNDKALQIFGVYSERLVVILKFWKRGLDELSITLTTSTLMHPPKISKNAIELRLKAA